LVKSALRQHSVKCVYVLKHKLLVMDMQFSKTKRQHKKFEPRVLVWKLKEEKM